MAPGDATHQLSDARNADATPNRKWAPRYLGSVNSGRSSSSPSALILHNTPKAEESKLDAFGSPSNNWMSDVNPNMLIPYNPMVQIVASVAMDWEDRPMLEFDRTAKSDVAWCARRALAGAQHGEFFLLPSRLEHQS